ncbi:MAG TPA: hypothetical protein VGI79_03075 [Caulobacteraceae bacterium]|jgi:hypothetical protein
MTPTDWVTAAASCGMFLPSLGAVAITRGAHQARNDVLESDVKALDERLTTLEALKVAVEGLTRGIEHLGDRLVDSQKLNASEPARMADQIYAGQRLIDARFDAMEERNARELGEVKHGVRNIRRTLEREARAA